MKEDFGLSILLPASLTADAPSLREKTLKVGLVGRALSIFRVNQIIIYRDDESEVEDQGEEIELISTLLRYMETPQYLRKDLFPYMDELRFAGLLPPLRTYHHPLQDERNEEGDIREAAVVESKGDESRLNLGLPEEGIYQGELSVGDRVKVKLGSKLDDGRRRVYLASEDEIEGYWGYEVERSGDFARGLEIAKVDYTIGTSRRGQNLYEVIEGIKANKEGDMAIAFGGPYQGLYEIGEKQDFVPEDLFDVVVNAIPQQGTETVRTEGALIATLAIINIMPGRK